MAVKIDRYKKWIAGHEADIKKLLKEGAVDAEIASFLGCSPHTFIAIKKESETLRNMLSEGRRNNCVNVRNALLKRALGMEVDDVFEEAWEETDPDGKTKIKKHKRKTHKVVPPDPTAIRLYLALYQPNFSDAGEYQDELKRLDAICKVRQTEHTTTREIDSEVIDDDE